jgi:hypothetical protein
MPGEHAQVIGRAAGGIGDHRARIGIEADAGIGLATCDQRVDAVGADPAQRDDPHVPAQRGVASDDVGHVSRPVLLRPLRQEAWLRYSLPNL